MVVIKNKTKQNKQTSKQKIGYLEREVLVSGFRDLGEAGNLE